MINIPIIADEVDLRLVGGYQSHNGYGQATIVPSLIAPTFGAAFTAAGGIPTPAGVTHQALDDLQSSNFLATLRLRPTSRWDILLRFSYDHATSGGGAGQPTWIGPASLAAGELGAELGDAAILGNPPAFGGCGGLATTSTTCATLQNTLISEFNADGIFQKYVSGVNPGNHNATLDSLDVDRGSKLQGSGTITYDVNNNLQLKSITAYVEGKRFLQQDFDQSGFSLIDAVQNTTEQLITEEFQITGSAVDNRLKYTAGAFYYHKSASDLQFGFAAPSILGPAGETPASITINVTSVSGYAQASFAVTPKLNITGGLRYTAENKDLRLVGLPGAPNLSSGTNLSYLGEIDYTPFSHVMVYFKTSDGYRSGGPQESAGGLVPPFAPETVTDYEVGLKSDLLDRHLRLNMDYYHEDYSAVQQTVFFHGPNGNLLNGTENIGNAVVDGFELQATAIPIENLTLSAALSIMDPRYTSINPAIVGVSTSTPVGNVQKYAYSLSGDYLIPAAPGNINLHLDWHWQSATIFNAVQNPSVPPPGEGLTQQNPYGLLNARVSFTPGNGDIELALWAKNLLNQGYFAYINDQSTSLGLVNAFEGAPRTFGIDATWKFH